jgi:uncharacterized membrane protein
MRISDCRLKIEDWKTCCGRRVAGPSSRINNQQSTIFNRRGQYALWTVGSLALFLVLIGLVIDLGLFLREFRRAQNAMSAGAQAAAQRIDPATLGRSGQIVLLPDAHSVAQSYATLNAATTSVRVTSVELLPDHRVRARGVAGLRTPFFLSLLGFGSLRVNVSAVARPTFGAIQVGQ